MLKSKKTNKIVTNPRSIGYESKYTYQKQSKNDNINLEAQELIRCKNLGIYTKNIQTVELINFDENNKILITKRVQGKDLFHIVWNSTCIIGRLKGYYLNRNTLFNRIEELGFWLAKYHQTSINQNNERLGDWLKQSFFRKLKAIQDKKILPSDKIKKIEQHFGHKLENIQKPHDIYAHQVWRCRVHGDFTIHNIVVDNKFNLRILDFGDTRFSCNIEDVSRFYSSIWAIQHASLYRHFFFRGLPERFLKAYGLSTDIIQTEYFQSSLAFNFLTQLLAQEFMKHQLSWNSYRESRLITHAGLEWIYKQI